MKLPFREDYLDAEKSEELINLITIGLTNKYLIKHCCLHKHPQTIKTYIILELTNIINCKHH